MLALRTICCALPSVGAVQARRALLSLCAFCASQAGLRMLHRVHNSCIALGLYAGEVSVRKIAAGRIGQAAGAAGSA